MSLTMISGLQSYINTSMDNIYDNIASNVKKLSTGLQITEPADNPAGSAQSSSFRATLAALTNNINNAEEGISLLQTAESGLHTIDENLSKMKELAIQASTSTYTSTQRLVMQSEFELLAAEIDRVTENTEYNGTKLLNGNISSGSFWQSRGGWNEPNTGKLIFVGDKNIRSEDYYYLSLKNLDTQSLFENQSIAVSTMAAAQSALDVVSTAMITKENAEGWLGSLQNRLNTTIDQLEYEYLAIDNANSRLTSLDYAREMTDFVSNQIIAYSAVAMLSQANVLAAKVLDLI